jgi:hypothetical protein
MGSNRQGANRVAGGKVRGFDRVTGYAYFTAWQSTDGPRHTRSYDVPDPGVSESALFIRLCGCP